MKALILNNKIMDVNEVAFEVHPSMEWIDVPIDCESDWTIINSIPTAPEPYMDTRTYAEKRKAEYDQLNQFELRFDDLENGTSVWQDTINEIKGRYPK